MKPERTVIEPEAGFSEADAAAFSPDGRILATGGSVTNGTNISDRTLQLWDMSNPARPRPLGQRITSGSIQSLTFSPDSRTLVSSEYGVPFHQHGPAMECEQCGAPPVA